MHFAFMTSVAPKWSLQETCDAARRLGYQAIEIRVEWGHAADIPLDATREERQAAKAMLDQAGIAVASLALGARLARQAPAERAENVDRIARYAELAADLGAPVLRVFGGPLEEGVEMAQGKPWAAETLGQAADRASQWGVTPCLETHDSFRDPNDVLEVVTEANHANVGVVWHPNHHMRLGIPVEEGYRLLKPWIRHCHVNEEPRDPAESGGEGRPLIFGTGDGSVEAAVRTLKQDGYAGVVSWEWLNGRKTEYVEPEPYLARNAEQLAGFLANA